MAGPAEGYAPAARVTAYPGPRAAPAAEAADTAPAGGNTAGLAQAGDYTTTPVAGGHTAPTPALAIGGRTVPGAASGETAAEPATAGRGPAGEPAPAAATPASGGEEAAAPGGESGSVTGGSEAIRILGRALPSGAGAAVVASRAGAGREVAADRAALEANPPSLQAPFGLTPSGKVGTEGEAIEPPAAHAASVDAIPGGGEEPAPPDTSHVASDAPLPEGPSPEAIVDRAPEDPAARAARYGDMIAGMPVSDDSVNTDAGPPPPLELTDEADPGRVADQAAENEVGISAQWDAARMGMAEDEGIDDIYPTLPDVTLVAPVSARGAGIREVAEPAHPALRTGVRAGYDEGLGPAWAAEVARADADQTAAMDQRARDETDRRVETDREIARLEGEAVEEQVGARDQARADVATARAGWQADIDDARETYDGESTRIDADLDREVTARVAQADDEAQRHLDAGRDRAETERRATEGVAERRRAEAERKRDEADGFLDWIASKVKSFFRALQEGLKTLFDGLRRVVKGIIEGAKKLAAAAIELGRRAVVGIIRAFGRALELACDVFLAAFPAARDRAKELIRAGTDRAEAAVNRAAEALRAGVFALLDGLGAALTFILDVYEAFYSTLFSVLEMVVIGFIEVQRALFRLDLAATYAPGELEGQIYEEMIGADLTQPLVFEATPSEIADWEAGRTNRVGVEPEPGAGVGTGAGSAPAVPTEVEADNVVEFDPDPELVEELERRDGPVEFGENETPENTLAALHADAVAGGEHVGSVGEAAGTATDEQDAAPAWDEQESAGDGGPGSAVPGATTDAKLDYYINQPGPTECRTDTPKGPEGPPIPLSAKIGPLSKSQRARYMLNQAWTGVKHWASCNWPLIVAAVLAAIIAIAAIVAVSILTGGTAAAALSVLATVITGAMIIVAIVRAVGFLGDYLTKSLAGDIIGGAKGLARAFAVAAVEIIFAVLTYVTAGAFRVVAAGVKGAGRLAAGAARGAGRIAAGAAQQVGRGARASGRGLVRVGSGAVRVSGRLGRAAGRVGGALLSRGKLVIRNVAAGFERGAKNLRELGRRLGQRLRFRRFKIERSGRWFRLYGLINPWVLLASGEIKQIDDLGGVEVGDLVSVPGRRQPGIVVGIKTRTGGPRGSAAALDFESQAVAALRGKSPRAQREFHRTHLREYSTPSQIREALDVAGETSRNSRILAKNMRKTPHPGRPAGNPGDAAHHLVPSTDARGKIARKILADLGLDINDPANGMFLSASKHAKLHTNAAYQRIDELLLPATTRAEAVTILDEIAALIAANKFP